LKFADADAVAAEVRRLRSGYTQAGNWNLRQTCWHLNKAVRFSMQGGSTGSPGSASPGSAAKRSLQWATARIVLITGWVPTGVSAPQRVIPPTDAPESAIDEFLAALAELKRFSGEFGVHPRFGRLSRDQYMRLHWIHCSHHLGFLTPTTNGQV